MTVIPETDVGRTYQDWVDDFYRVFKQVGGHGPNTEFGRKVWEDYWAPAMRRKGVGRYTFPPDNYTLDPAVDNEGCVDLNRAGMMQQIVKVFGIPVWIDASVPRGTVYLKDNWWHAFPEKISVQTFQVALHRHRLMSRRQTLQNMTMLVHIDEESSPTLTGDMKTIVHYPLQILHTLIPGTMLWHIPSMTYTRVISTSEKRNEAGVILSVTLSGKPARVVNDSFRRDYQIAEEVNLRKYIHDNMPLKTPQDVYANSLTPDLWHDIQTTAQQGGAKAALEELERDLYPPEPKRGFFARLWS